MSLQYQDIVNSQQGLTADQLAEQAQMATSPSSTTNTNSGVSGITPASLISPNPIQLPTISATAGTMADGLAASVSAGQKPLSDYITSLTPPTTNLDTQNQSILDSIAQLTGQNSGKTQTLAQEQINAGVPDLQRQLTDLNGQMTIGNAEYAKLQADQANQYETLGGADNKAVLAAQQSGLIRAQSAQKAAKAADLALIYAKSQAISGNIQTALAIAQNAVEARYAPIEDALKVKQAQLAAIQPQLDKEQKIQATALQRQYEDQQQAIADEKEKQKQVQNIMVQAAQSGADQSTLDKIQKSSTPEEAISLAGYSLGAEFRQKIAQQEFDNKIQTSQLAISKANLGIAQARLAFDKTKEAFDEAVKLAGPNGTVKLDEKGNPTIAPAATVPMQQAMTKANVDLISSLTTDKGLNSAVGPNYLARFSVVNQLSGVKSNFIAGVQQLTGQLTLDSLVRAKAQGATFGALSEGELNILSSSASKLNSWAIKDGQGNVTGYNTSEKNFRSELDKINNFAKLDYVLKGGNPNDVNVKKEGDGTYTTINSDGSITSLGN